MIEIAWKDLSFTIHHVTNLLAWLMQEIHEQNIYLTGYLVCHDVSGNLHTVLICDGENQTKIFEKLKQPPGEFQGKYVACVHNDEEHEPVTEVKPKIESESETDSEEET